jgi:hypothetical protein
MLGSLAEQKLAYDWGLGTTFNAPLFPGVRSRVALGQDVGDSVYANYSFG